VNIGMNMKHTTVISFSLLLFSFLAGCDYAERRVTEGERSDRLYQTAMAEYAAGRLDKSIDGFEKVLKANPGNASARFQLACLMQDHRKDPMEAIRNYREYVSLFPGGDKVKIANERAAACERQLATVLVKKYNLGGIVAQDEAIQRLKGENAKLAEELDAAKKELDEAKNTMSALRRENERVRRMVMAGASDDAAEVKTKSEKVKSEDGEVAPPEIPSEKELVEDDGADVVDRVKFSADVDNLIAEEKDETGERAPFGKTVRPEKPQEKPAVQEPPHEKRPEYYVVQEGDTLFKLAVRFYGRKSAWTVIREANKATVSSDGRIKAGQKLRLP